MKKDAYYFPHYCNSRTDRKLKRVIKDLGVEGYGVYFMLLEVLREQTDFRYPLEDVDLLADEFNVSEAKVNTVINNYKLFEIIDNKFFSPKLILYLQPYIEKSERARAAANKRWDKVNSDANALLEHNKCIADQNASKVKESKVKESKVDIVDKPTKPKKLFYQTKEDLKEDLKNYLEKYDRDMLNEFYAYWTEKDVDGKLKVNLNKTWCIERRLATWKKKGDSFNKDEKSLTKTKRGVSNKEIREHNEKFKDLI